VNKRLLLATLLLALLSAGRLYAKEYLALQGNGTTVLYEGPVEKTARAVMEVYPAVRAELEGALGFRADFRPEILVVKSREDFRRMTGDEITVAYAQPSRNLIVIDGTNINIKPFTLDATLKHEVCHLMLNRRVGRGSLPRWLDEGVCQWLGGRYSEVMGLGRGRALTKAALFKSLIPLGKLNRRFPKDRRQRLLAYEESKSVVEYIKGKYGTEALLSILESLRAGDGMDAAMRKAVSLSLDGLEQEWHGHLRRRHTWVAFLSNNIYEVLFVLAALVLVYGFVRAVIRIKTYRDEEEEEEGGWRG
jgi:hypothetical protein